MPILPPDCSLATIDQRCDIWDAICGSNQPLEALWPVWFEGDETQLRYMELLGKIPSIARFQIVVLQVSPSGHEDIIAMGNTIPFFWPEISNQGRKAFTETLETLPDGGFDTILSRGVLQAHARGEVSLESTLPITGDQELDIPTSQRTETPNTLSALAVAVRPDRRQLGLAVIIIETMKNLARRAELQLLVVPVRPTRKHEFPTVDIADYIKWTLPGTLPVFADLKEIPASQAYDPWLRKHLRLGGQFVKVASSSINVHGTAVQWKEWTGIDFNTFVKEDSSTATVQAQDTSKEMIFEITVERGLAPLRFNVREQVAWYIEPNVWICHSLDK
ncbi:hypothetical protein G7Y79_00005g017520 [Physcia stellaris]|nr:hypothetical protein G7Y79_00005g017520 [Physcia stellaris]